MLKCSDLLKELEYECIRGSIDVEISEIVNDSRKVTEDCLFLCIEGPNFDAHTVAADVVNQLSQAMNELEETSSSFTSDIQQADIVRQVIEQIKVFSGNDIVSFDCIIYNQEDEVASATINVYQSENIEKGALNV